MTALERSRPSPSGAERDRAVGARSGDHAPEQTSTGPASSRDLNIAAAKRAFRRVAGGSPYHLMVGRHALGALYNAHRIPAWWSRFAGYDRWLHDGTCGGWIDDNWMIARWPSSRPIVILDDIGPLPDHALMGGEFARIMAQLVTGAAVMLPDDVELEFITPRDHGKREAQRVELERRKGGRHDTKQRSTPDP